MPNEDERKCETILVTEDEKTFGKLKSPPKRVCGLDTPIPYSPPMEHFVVPDKEKKEVASMNSKN